jgi:hypothetical protein
MLMDRAIRALAVLVVIVAITVVDMQLEQEHRKVVQHIVASQDIHPATV